MKILASLIDLKKGIKMKKSLISMAVVLSIVSLFLNGPPAYGDSRRHYRGGGRASSSFSGSRHFASMPSRGGQTFTRSRMGNWSGQRWGGRNWNGGNWSGQRSSRNWNGGTWSGQRWGGRNWNGGNWGGNNIIFIGDFGFPLWWGWGYPYGYYGYGYPYDSYGYGYGAYGYGYGGNSYGYPYGGYGYGYGGNGYGYGDNGYGYSYGGNDGSYYGGTGYGNGYPTHSRVAQLQRRLARAGYYSGAIDGIMGPATQRAIRAYGRDHGYAGSSDGTQPSTTP